MTISEQIIQVIDNLCTKFGIAINWTGENVIPYLEVLCKKLITYEIATSAMWILLVWVLFGVSALTLKKMHPWLMKKSNESFDEIYEFMDVVLWITTIILGIVMICITCDQAIDIIKCFTFPEMYVFEYVSALMK
jgi:hypothetical protein